MKDIKIHDIDHNNLCSIKSVEKGYSDKQYFFSILSRLFNLTGHLFVQARRPYYNVESAIQNLRSIRDRVDDLNITPNFFEISFYFDGPSGDDDLFNLITDIWFEYEQPTFCFFYEKHIHLSEKKISWQEITRQWDSFVIFRGAEEDVVWIGKSSELKFSNIIPELL